jgi:peroxiredoxin
MITPDFSLVDASGNEIKLGDFKGKKNVVLVFYAQHS